MQQLLEKLHYNFIADLKKKEIDVRERAVLIDSYMRSHNLSYRDLATMFNIPHTTIHGWLSILNYSETEYNQMKQNGFNEADIFNAAKYKSKKAKVNPDRTKLELDLETVIDILRGHSKHTTIRTNEELKELLREIKDMLNRIEMQLEKNLTK